MVFTDKLFLSIYISLKRALDVEESRKTLWCFYFDNLEGRTCAKGGGVSNRELLSSSRARQVPVDLLCPSSARRPARPGSGLAGLPRGAPGACLCTVAECGTHGLTGGGKRSPRALGHL